MVTYYKTDCSKISLPELWRLSKRNVFTFSIAAILTKIFRLKLSPNIALGRSPELILLETTDLTMQALRKMEPLWQEDRQLGQRLQFIYTIPGISVRSFAAALVDAEGIVVSQVLYSKAKAGSIVEEVVIYVCVTQMSDGMLLATSTERKMFNPPPYAAMENMPDKSVAEVLTRHRERVAHYDRGSATKIHDVQRFLGEHSVRHIDHMEQRGIYYPILDEEAEMLREMDESI